MSSLVTAVIGAGPAGLLFSIAARVLHERSGGARETLPLWLFDKRLKYGRTHRLRMAEGPYRALAEDLQDPRFDALITFLERHRFSPEVNLLEERLQELAAHLGIHKEHLTVGTAPGELTLAGLRQWLEERGRLRPEDTLSVVGADSVHSAVRDLVQRGSRPVERTHQHLTRLRVTGPGLPATLGVVNQFKLSKVLASLLDYRLGSQGYAEVDLFLTAREHRQILQLGASPRAPVSLTPELLHSLGAPFFARIVNKLREGFGAGECIVSLQSTFKLEHRNMEPPAFELPELRAKVFLVGDAAVSLPFQRGMACLARCARSLAHVHRELAASVEPTGEERQPSVLARRYCAEVREARRHEMRVVSARALIVRGAREFVRVSAALPFPMQSWLFSVPENDSRPERLTLSFWVNLLLAILAAGAALSALLLASRGDPRSSWGGWLAVLAQTGGGLAYGIARELEGGPQRRTRAVWRSQILALFLFGAALALWTSSTRIAVVAALCWFLLAIPFVLGLYLFEALDRRWWKHAEL